MFPPLHLFFSNGYQPFLFSFSSSLSPFHILSNSLHKSLLPLSHSLPILTLSSFLISTSLSNFRISFNGTQVQEEFLHPFHRYLPSHLLEWSSKADDGSFLDLQITTTPFGECKDRISKFFKLFLLLSFSFDLPFWYVFRLVNAWVLLWDRFRWKPDTLGGVGTCLGWVLVEKRLRMLKNTLLCLFLYV